MKVLKVLERFFDDNCYITDEEISEAIKELEELENRSCSICSKNSYLDCPCWTYSDGKITDIKYCSEWTKKG